jgi:glycosyltransferase domain-containing protein
MAYADRVKFPFKVFIADGGCDQRVPKLLSDPASFPNVDYEYVRYPYDETYTQFYSKVDDALSRVQTPFVAMADNDDFFSVEGLGEATRFVVAHPEYVSCGGQRASFWVIARDTSGAGLLYGDNIECKYDYCVRSAIAETAKERILRQWEGAIELTYYNVKRTDELRRQFQVVKDVDLKDLYLVEVLLEFLTVIAGNTKQLEGLYYACQVNSPGGSAFSHQEKFGDWFGRMLVPTWSEDFGKFVDATSKALASADRMSFPEAQECIVKAYRMYVAPDLLSNILEEPSITVWMPSIRRLVQHLVGLPADSAIRRIGQRLYRRLPWIPYGFGGGRKLVSGRVGKAPQEFEPIARFLAGPPSPAGWVRDAAHAP